MAAAYRVCVSTNRVARVDSFPNGAEYPYHIDVIQVSYLDDGILYDVRTDCLAVCYEKEAEGVERLLKHFGLDWEPVQDLAAAIDVLVDAYDERSAALCGYSS